MSAGFATDRLRAAGVVPKWGAAADVVVVRLGSAGAYTALEARRAELGMAHLDTTRVGGMAFALAQEN